MTSKSNKLRAKKALLRKPKKRPNMIVTEKVGFVDYKDVNLLQRYMSDRSKLRARRMNGNSVQLQRDVATAVKNAREMALLPYTKRVSATRAPRERGEYGSDDKGRDRGPRRPRRDDAPSLQLLRFLKTFQPKSLKVQHKQLWTEQHHESSSPF